MARPTNLYSSWLDKIITMLISIITAVVMITLFAADVKNATKTNATNIENMNENFKEFKKDVKEDVKDIKEDIEYVRKLIENKYNHD